MACQPCRAKKIKCDRARPVCRNCRERANHCSYAGERRTRRWAEADVERVRAALNGGLHRAENQVTPDPSEATSLPSESAAATATAPSAVAAPVLGAAVALRRPPVQSPRVSAASLWHHHADTGPGATIFPHAANNAAAAAVAPLQTPGGSSTSQAEDLLDKILDGDDVHSPEDFNPAVWMRLQNGDEYTGPSSGISAVSDMGLDWLRQNVPDSEHLCKTIQDIKAGILSYLRQPKCIAEELDLSLPLPQEPVDLFGPEVLRYVDAYFSTVQVVFPILDRERFLAQLSAAATDSTFAQSHSWLALLNAVLASGCRVTHSDESAEAFKTSACEAWRYFQTALSYEPQLIHGTTDLTAVQAMAVMAVFAQGLSSPQRLEYTLSSIASRLAQSLGLNRQPSADWNLTDDEVRERNRVFWVIYCLDRTIALRCGRPAVICDDEISCSFPRGLCMVPQGGDSAAATAEGQPDFDFFQSLTKLARIAGHISRSLYSSTAILLPCSRLLPTLNRLMQDLELWLHALPINIRPGTPVARILGRCGLLRIQIIILHSSYYYALCSIFRRASSLFDRGSRSLEHLIDKRSHVSHIEAARSIVLLTKHLDIESFTPAW